MFKQTIFFDKVRAGILGPKLDSGEVYGCDDLINAFAGFPVADVAYALGTAYLETGSSMQPVKEANWLSTAAANRYFFRMYDIGGERPRKARELGNIHPGDGVKFCGRGYPQVTGRTNYEKAELATGIPFVSEPDRMMESGPAAKYMAFAMKTGAFTTKKLADYLPRIGPATLEQFVPARRIINGTDRARDVATFAMKFQQALVAAGWRS